MRPYMVRFSRQAIEDINASYQWGIETWGIERAAFWADQFEAEIEDRLSTFPLSCPLAPESSAFEFEIRQFHIGRYRVLFSVAGGLVRVLRCRGPFSK